MIHLVTVSDDRFGRKNGLYFATQKKIHSLFYKEMECWPYLWESIEQTEFYRDNKTLLSNTDAARNGRAYKPYVILTRLQRLSDGEYLVYNDCSPELWETYPTTYDLNKIKQLCIEANDILVPFIKWGRKPLGPGDLGEATHKNYTLNRCMDKMGLRFYEDSFMCASGMICIRKTPETVALVEEWLKWNLIDECCALGWAHIPGDASFWAEESHEEFGKEGYKMGCRHDQSILGLLLARTNHKFCYVEPKIGHPANFLQYCQDYDYKFIECNPPLKVGDKVVNKQGTVLRVYDTNHNGRVIVGQNNASLYEAERYNLKKI